MILGSCYGILQYKLIMSLSQEDLIWIKNECKTVDFACPFNGRIEEREKNKMKGYNDLKRELKKIWDIPMKEIPVVVVGALRTAPKKLKQRLSVIGIEPRIV